MAARLQTLPPPPRREPPCSANNGAVHDTAERTASQPGRSFYGLLYVVALAVYAAVAWPHTHPPYMDSFYYVDIARNLAHGQGLTENMVWNYLSGTPPLRHPSSTYWLPGMSLLLAPLWALGAGYRGAALLTCALAALCVVLSARAASAMLGTRRHALTAAGLTLFNGLWFHDWTSPDAFVLFAALATVTFLLAGKGMHGDCGAMALAGLTAGLAALTRQEGLLLFAAVLIAVPTVRGAWRPLWPAGILGAVALFLLVQAPWWLHNLAASGQPLGTGSSKALWMHSYDSFYALHTAGLTLRNYLAWGMSQILHAKLEAGLFTLAIWAGQWLAVLVPPLVLGMWRLRRSPDCRTFMIYWAMLALAMPLLFTATLEHGTLQHATGALVPFAAVCIAAGIDVIGRALSRGRAQIGARLARDVGMIAISIAAVTSLGMAWRTFPARGDEYTLDVRVVAWLHAHNPAGVPVMVLDPPAFSYIDDAPYVVAPSDSLDAAREVAVRYGVRYWALDPIHAGVQDPVYTGRVQPGWLRQVADIAGVRIFAFRRIPQGRDRGSAQRLQLPDPPNGHADRYKAVLTRRKGYY
jgi:4-amino-4-deoxy-L-arabinose transferase-like glycosyltransferase